MSFHQYSYHFTHKGAMWWATRQARRTGWRYQVRCVRPINPRYPKSKFVVRPASS